MHDQEMIHGDLKGVRLRTLVYSSKPHLLTRLYQGEHPDRQERLRTSSRLRTSYDRLRPHKLHNVGFHDSAWNGTMDEPGTPRSGPI